MRSKTWHEPAAHPQMYARRGGVANTVSLLVTFSCNSYVVASTKRAKIAHFIGRPTRQHKSGSIMGSTCSHTFQGTTPTVIKKGRNQLGSQGGGGGYEPICDPLRISSIYWPLSNVESPPSKPNYANSTPSPRQEWDCEAFKECHHMHLTYIHTVQGTWNTARSIIHTVQPLQWDQMVDSHYFHVFTDFCPRLQFSRCPVASNYLIALALRHRIEVLPINVWHTLKGI